MNKKAFPGTPKNIIKWKLSDNINNLPVKYIIYSNKANQEMGFS